MSNPLFSRLTDYFTCARRCSRDEQLVNNSHASVYATLCSAENQAIIDDHDECLTKVLLKQETDCRWKCDAAQPKRVNALLHFQEQMDTARYEVLKKCRLLTHFDDLEMIFSSRACINECAKPFHHHECPSYEVLTAFETMQLKHFVEGKGMEAIPSECSELWTFK